MIRIFPFNAYTHYCSTLYMTTQFYMELHALLVHTCIYIRTSDNQIFKIRYD